MANLRGILLIVFSMAAFSVEDAVIKTLTGAMPVGQVMLSLGLGGVVVFAAVAGPRAWPRIARALFVPQVALRTACEAAGAISFITALSLVPLSTVAAVFQATPLAVAAGAALFFGERVGWRRWSAISAGFAGVLMILRPGLAGFDPAVTLVLITVIAIALRDLVTRRIPADVPSVSVAFHGFLALVASGGVLVAAGDGTVSPQPADWARFAGAIACGTSGYYAIVAAMRAADASALMPFRYARLVFSLAIGVAVFAEHPDTMTLAGATLIVGAAFYTYLRERRVLAAARPA